MTKPSKSIEQLLMEVAICAGSSSINFILGVLFVIGLSATEFNKIKNNFNWKLLCLLAIKLFILLLYPFTILALTKYQFLFVTTFGLKLQPIDGFGAAVAIFILHSSINIKLYNMLNKEVSE
jgi:hypothetical protein